mmetsp:Transcript_56397/g.99629  ORF Transcript_56397/g.99629 Transcript_56397/m.99629 type:complete len:97 (+) Transcript_56397:418-708(+)
MATGNQQTSTLLVMKRRAAALRARSLKSGASLAITGHGTATSRTSQEDEISLQHVICETRGSHDAACNPVRASSLWQISWAIVEVAAIVPSLTYNN